MTVQHINFMLWCQYQKAAPVRDQLKQRPHLYKVIILPHKMCMSAAPAVLSRILYQLRGNRIHLDIPGSGQQVLFIHGKRGESFLPQMSPPFFAKIDPPGITSMCLTNGAGETFLAVRYGD